MSTITIGVDLAKSLFSVCEMDAAGHVLGRRDLGREAFALWLAQRLAQRLAGTVVAMEACSGAHHWARRCLEYGLQPRLMAAQFVTPFRKSRTSKNDRNDAEAIATAARQGNMRFVPVKDVDQQARLAWHRVREGYKTESLAIGNRLRGLLAEFGVVVAKGDVALHRVLAALDQHAALPDEFKELLRDLSAHWAQVRAGVQERSTTGRMAGCGADTALQRWTHAAWHDQLSWRCVPSHVADPGRAQQSAAGQIGQRGKVHAEADLDTTAGWPDAVRQGAGGDCQQARAPTVGDARA
jgi:transposase